MVNDILQKRQQQIDDRSGFLLVLSVYFHNPLLFNRCNINLTTTYRFLFISANIGLQQPVMMAHIWLNIFTGKKPPLMV